MKLNDIAAISGKGGLFKVLKPSRTGVVLESLDAKKKRLVANMNQRVSVLEEISIYTLDEEGSVPLADVFLKINDEFGDDPGVDSKSDGDELFAFLRHILPDFDEDKVYASDVKKLVSWYKIILAHFPERFTEEDEEEETKATEGAPKAEEPEAKEAEGDAPEATDDPEAEEKA